MIFSLLLILAAAQATAGSYSIDAAAWQQPRSAAMVKSLPAVEGAVQELLANDGSRLLIRHQGGEEGALWGAELRDWLVSLGIPPDRMAIEAAEVAPAALQLEVLSKGLKLQ